MHAETCIIATMRCIFQFLRINAIEVVFGVILELENDCIEEDGDELVSSR